MVAVGWGMLVLGLFGLLTSSVFLGMVVVGARRFRREAARQDARFDDGAGVSARGEFVQAASWRWAFAGGKSRTFFEQDYLQHAGGLTR